MLSNILYLLVASVWVVTAQESVASTSEILSSATTTTSEGPAVETLSTTTETSSSSNVFTLSTESTTSTTGTASEDFTISDSSTTSTSPESSTTITYSSSTLEISSSSTSTANETATEEDSLPLETQLSVTDHGIPPVVPKRTIEEVTDLNAIEIQTYAETIIEGGIPLQEGEVAPPVVLPHCPDTGSGTLKKRAFFGLFKDREKRPIATCIPRRIQIKVAFFYVANGTSTKTTPVVPSDVKARIRNNMQIMSMVFAPLNIVFLFDASTDIQARRNQKFSNHNSESRAANNKFKRENRVAGLDVLNIWIVNTIDQSPTSSTTTAGYSFIPSGRIGDEDGVVMAINAMSLKVQELTVKINPESCTGSGLDGSSLIHEVGHWLGLEHIFGSEEDRSCNLGDSIADTGLFPNTDARYCCQQLRCNVKDARKEDVINWMSYSVCAGTLPGSNGLRRLNIGNSFTPGQKAVMFAAFSKFRRATPCSQANNKRDLEARQEAQVKSAELIGDLLLKNCSCAIQDVFVEETIPLPASKLASLSSSAAVLKATPPPDDPANPRPATRTVGTLTLLPTTADAGVVPTTTSSGSSSAKATPNVAVSTNPALGVTRYGLFTWLLGVLIL